MIDLSVLIPTNNLSMKTVQTVNSIYFKDMIFEILVVIDSVARVDDEAYKQLSKTSRVKILKSNSGCGISETLNCGITRAAGDLILRLDDGDINLRFDLTEELELLKSFDLVCASMSIKYGKSRSRKVITPRIIYRKGRLSPFSRVPHPTWVFKRDSIKTLYQSIDHRCEDFGFLVRNSLRVGYVKRPAIEYDACNSLGYLSELKSVFYKWRICHKKYSPHWIMIECSLYVLIRLIRLSITTKKVI